MVLRNPVISPNNAPSGRTNQLAAGRISGWGSMVMRSVAVLLLLSSLASVQDGGDSLDRNLDSKKGIIGLPVERRALEIWDGARVFQAGDKWQDAMRLYQQLIEEYADKALPLAGDPDAFVGVSAWCERYLFSNPPALRAFRRSFDEEIKARVDRAAETGDRKTLKRLATFFAAAEPGRELLFKLAHDGYENAEFEDAEFFAWRSIELYPDTLPVVAPLLMMMLARRGDAAGLADLLDACASRGVDRSEIALGDEKASLRSFIERRIEKVEPRSDYLGFADHFLPRAGSISRSTAAWRYGADSAVSSRATLIAPALSRGILVANFDAHSVHLEMSSGKILSRRNYEASGRAAFDRPTGGRAAPLVEFYAASVADELAFILVPDRAEGSLQPRHVVEGVLREGGNRRLRWDDSAMSVLAPPSAGEFGIIVGASRITDRTVPPDSCVARLDPKTAAPDWITFLCHTDAGVSRRYNLNEPAPILVSAHRGMLYVATNDGVYAALEPITGRLRWIRTYPQGRKGPMPAPPLFWKNVVIVCSGDGDQILGLDAPTGRVRWSCSVPSTGTVPTFVEGVVDGKLLLSGERVVCLDAASGRRIWEKTARQTFVGKGTLSRDSLYCPGANGIECYSLQDGSFRMVTAWEKPAIDPGHLMLVEGGFLAVSDERVVLYRRSEK